MADPNLPKGEPKQNAHSTRIGFQDAAYVKSPSFRFFENKLTEHEYMRACGLPHVKVLDMGYFNAEHGASPPARAR